MIAILQNNWWYYLLAFSISFVSSWCVFKFGTKLLLVDNSVTRSSHKGGVAKGGGIGIVFVAILHFFVFTSNIWLLIICLLSFFSFLGDRKEIAVQLRFLMQFVCASGILYFANPFFFGVSLMWIFFVFFLVATTNFFNFMDGIDGIATLNAIISFVFLGVYSQVYGLENWIVFCVLMVFALLGFLPWNLAFFQRKIFMGDVGSVFLGASIATSILLISQSWFDFFRLCSLLFLFYSDCVFTLFTKKLRKIDFSQPHRLHFYQVLANEAAIPHLVVSIYYALVQICIVALIFIFAKTWLVLFVLFFVILLTLFLFYIYVRRRITGIFF